MTRVPPPYDETELVVGTVGSVATCVGAGTGTGCPDRGTGVCAKISGGNARSEYGVEVPWEAIHRQ